MNDTTVAERAFTARVWREGEWYVAQALEVDIASQGESVEDALDNLREALELHFEAPVATAASCSRILTLDESHARGNYLDETNTIL